MWGFQSRLKKDVDLQKGEMNRSLFYLEIKKIGTLQSIKCRLD